MVIGFVMFSFLFLISTDIIVHSLFLHRSSTLTFQITVKTMFIVLDAVDELVQR